MIGEKSDSVAQDQTTAFQDLDSRCQTDGHSGPDTTGVVSDYLFSTDLNKHYTMPLAGVFWAPKCCSF